MSAPVQRSGQALGVTLLSGVLLALLMVAATLFTFSAFMFYDDEGYVLLSLRNFAQHGGLYSDVYTQYGPFPFLFYYALQTIGVSITHNLGRLITIAAWSGTAVLCGAIVNSQNRSRALGITVASGAFVYLWVMVNEPAHPGSLIGFLTAYLAFAGYQTITANRLRSWALRVGAVGAALLLTKINVGIFAIYSAAVWILLHHESGFIRKWGRVTAIASSILLPFALMHTLIKSEWVMSYAVVFATSAISVILVSGAWATARIGWRSIGVAILTGTTGVLVMLAVVVIRGTKPADLLNGLLLAPLRQPVVFTIRYIWPLGILWLTGVSLLACVVFFMLRRRHAGKLDWIVAGARVVAAVGAATAVLRFPDIRPDYLVFGFVMPCLWLYIWPLSGEDARDLQARVWLTLLLLGQCLHVFPVPGSQIAWGSILALPLAALGAQSALSWMAEATRQTRWGRLNPGRGGQIAVLAVACVTTGRFLHTSLRYTDGLNIEQPGAELIRLPDASAGRIRVLSLNAIIHADLLFSMPGMFSFNLWTGLPTPTHSNVTHWFSLLDDKKQQAIVDTLQSHPHACVIVDEGHVEFLKKWKLPPGGLLHDYISREFEPAFIIDNFEFRVHRGRQIRPFMVAESFIRSSTAMGQLEKNLLTCTLPRLSTRRIGMLEIRTPSGRLLLNESNARIKVAPVNASGEPIGDAQQQNWPFSLERPSALLIYFDGDWKRELEEETTIVFRDVSGREVGVARIGQKSAPLRNEN